MEVVAGAARRDTTDASCQTDSGPVPAPVPLPLHYPANLIYAQSMLAICINQQQRIELNIAMLNFYLREHEERARAAANLAASKMVKLRLTPPVVVFQHGGTTVAAAAAAPAQATPAAGAAEGAQAAAPPPPAAVAAVFGLPPPAQLERMQMHRRRIAAAVKIALVMVLLEFRAGWFFLYFFTVFLYIGGVFDPVIDWALQRHATQATLEQQLLALRHRQHLLVPPGDRQQQQQQQQAQAQAQAPAPEGQQDQGAAPAAAAATATAPAAAVEERQQPPSAATQEESDTGAAPHHSEVARPEIGEPEAAGLASEGLGAAPRTGPSQAPAQGGAARLAASGSQESAAGPQVVEESTAAEDAPGGIKCEDSEGVPNKATASSESAAIPTEELGPLAATAEQGDGGAAPQPQQPAAATSEAPQQARPPPPPWAHRFIYQLVVMFFMTLIPWWNPDPRYLRDDP